MPSSDFTPAPSGSRRGKVSTLNSSTATLAGDAVFTGTAEDVSGFGGISIFAYSDVDSADNGLLFQSSSDGINWDSSLPVTLTGGTREIHTLAVISKYFRVVYTNGSSAQSEFRLQTIFTANDGKLTSRASSVISQDYDVQLTRVVSEYGTDVASGLNPERSVVSKFGEAVSLTTSYTPVSIGQVYQTPQVSGATTLRIRAGNANDTAAGSGAREITLEGLDETGAFATETLATAGTSASSATTTTWLRLFRAYVSKSGTYATSAGGSHSADIDIETTGGTLWATIDSTGFPKSQTQIGVYTIPLGKTGFLREYHLTVNTSGTKTVDFAMFKRENILETSPPYTGMTLLHELIGVGDTVDYEYKIPTVLPALTDFGFMAKGASSPDATVEFTIELVDS